MNDQNNSGLTTDQCQRLAGFLEQAWAANRVTIDNVTVLSGGAIQENLAVSVTVVGGDYAGDHDVVLRTDAPTQVAVSLDRLQEFKVLQLAFDTGLTVPKPIVACADMGVICRPFVIMGMIGGLAPGHKLVKLPVLEAKPDALVGQLGQQLARLHQITPTAEARQRLDFLPVPKQTAKATRIDLYREYLDQLVEADTPDCLAFEWGLRWLELHMPDTGPITLIHADFRTGNYMVAPETGDVTGVLDWEFAAWSDPMEDLGWLTAPCWRFGRPDREVGGVGTREALYAAYNHEAERLGVGHRVDPDRVVYWEIMALIRWGIIARQQGERCVASDEHTAEPSLELALTGLIASECAHQMLAHIRRIEGAEMAAPDREGLGV